MVNVDSICLFNLQKFVKLTNFVYLNLIFHHVFDFLIWKHHICFNLYILYCFINISTEKQCDCLSLWFMINDFIIKLKQYNCLTKLCKIYEFACCSIYFIFLLIVKNLKENDIIEFFKLIILRNQLKILDNFISFRIFYNSWEERNKPICK